MKTMMDSRTEKVTVQIPRCEANWIAVVKLAPVVMPVAKDDTFSRATTMRLEVLP